MTLFAVWATDADGTLSTRERVRPAHRARLRAPGTDAVKVVLAGPTLESATGSMNGTLLILEAEDLHAAQRFVQDDPYSQAGVYQRVEIRPFVCGLGPLAPS